MKHVSLDAEELLSFDRSFIRDLLYQGESNTRNYEIAKKALRRVLAEDLTERQREIIMLRYYEDLRVGEIAKRLGCDHSTVSKLLKRAYRRIEKSMRWYIEYMHIGDGES